jgi:IS30 family transposase
MAAERINNRPRKTLGFKTATQMMEKSFSRMAA